MKVYYPRVLMDATDTPYNNTAQRLIEAIAYEAAYVDTTLCELDDALSDVDASDDDSTSTLDEIEAIAAVEGWRIESDSDYPGLWWIERY
ncbi:hypothetical protein [Tsukamurella soli]|uniref:Uncharacterized protein n=1 Tax=Tsukamurella soli TaxID=644556 RepID=A0ABP8JJG7_9ACTN